MTGVDNVFTTVTAPESIGRPRGRVLIIEDEALIALETSSHLEDWGYAVCGIAGNSIEALRQAEETRPELALVDVNLGGGDDGVMLARILRERYGTAVLFLTGSSDPLSRRRIAAVRPAGCVFKPYSPAELRSAIAGALPAAYCGGRGLASGTQT